MLSRTMTKIVLETVVATLATLSTVEAFVATDVFTFTETPLTTTGDVGTAATVETVSCAPTSPTDSEAIGWRKLTDEELEMELLVVDT